MKLPDFSVKQPVATLMLYCVVILLGSIALTRLKIDMFPDIEPPVVSILTTWPGASASDVETEVTEVIEDQATLVNNLDTLTSKSLDNLSVVLCKFDWGTDLNVATNDIRDRLEIAKRDLPRDVEPPILYKFSSATAPILFMTISADKSWPRLYHLVDKNMSDELKRIPGVGAILLYGGLRRRINVYFDIKKVEAFHLSMARVNQVLAAENLNLPAGSIKSGYTEYFVRVPSRYLSAGEIEGTIVGSFRGRPVYLRDVASVEDAFKPEDLNGWGDGKKAIVMLLQKQTGKNTVAVIERVKRRLEEMKRELPPDVKINIVTDNSENILTSVGNLRHTLFEALVGVVLVTFLFLRRVRAGLIIFLTIPFSLITCFILLYASGYTINLVSLMALAIAAGMVVDDGIVVLENVVRHLERGGNPRAGSIFGASEMGMAITASTMTTVVVFVPLMFLTGLTGIIFKQLGFVIVVTMLASLFTALTMTPMLCSQWLGRAPGGPKGREGILGRLFDASERAFQAVDRGYGRLLGWALDHGKTVLVLASVVFLSSLPLVPFLSTSFMPEVDTGDLSVTFRLKEGTRIEETNRVVDRILKTINEVVSPVELRHSMAFDGQSEKGIGVAMGFDEGPNIGEIHLKLVDRARRSRSAKEVANRLRERVVTIPGTERIMVTAKDPVTSTLLGRGKPISVEILGQDLDANYRFARQLAAAVRGIPGLVDVEISQKEPRPELWVEVDRQKASSLGLNTYMIAGSLRNYFYGIEATQFRDAGDSFDIFTRLRRKDKNRLASLPAVPIFTPDGRMIQLRNIAEIKQGEGPIEIERKNRQKVIKVEADTYGISLGEGTGRVEKVLEGMEIPPGIRARFGGEVEEQGKAFRDLKLLLVLSVVLVYMVLASLYGNLRDPLIILFSIPFAFTGVLYAFSLTGTTLGVMTFMGIVMLMGIVVKNAIVLLDYTHLLLKRGSPLYEGTIEAGRNRLRPVLMTTFTTLFGMIPLAVSRSVGAEVWNPLGITMVGGLSVSTLVTLVLIPTIFYMLEKRKRARREES